MINACRNNWKKGKQHFQLFELIDNSVDANATKINITFTPDKILFEDNGTGVVDMNALFTFGASVGGEHRRGRFGVGFKDAIIAMGNCVSIVSFNGGNQKSAIIDIKRIEQTGDTSIDGDTVKDEDGVGTHLCITDLLPDWKMSRKKVESIGEKIAAFYYMMIREKEETTGLEIVISYETSKDSFSHTVSYSDVERFDLEQPVVSGNIIYENSQIEYVLGTRNMSREAAYRTDGLVFSLHGRCIKERPTTRFNDLIPISPYLLTVNIIDSSNSRISVTTHKDDIDERAQEEILNAILENDQVSEYIETRRNETTIIQLDNLTSEILKAANTGFGVKGVDRNRQRKESSKPNRQAVEPKQTGKTRSDKECASRGKKNEVSNFERRVKNTFLELQFVEFEPNTAYLVDIAGARQNHVIVKINIAFPPFIPLTLSNGKHQQAKDTLISVIATALTQAVELESMNTDLFDRPMPENFEQKFSFFYETLLRNMGG